MWARAGSATVRTVGFRVVPAPLGVACACAAGHAPHLPPRRRGRRLRRARAPVRGSYPGPRRRRVRRAAGGRAGAVQARGVGRRDRSAFGPITRSASGPLVLYDGQARDREGGRGAGSTRGRGLTPRATLVVIGDGPLVRRSPSLPRTRLLGPMARAQLPVAYAAAPVALLPSVPTPRFREPWGLVCNEAMHQGGPVIATTAVGAVAGGLVRDGETGLVVAPGDPVALAHAIDRLLADAALRDRLGAAARTRPPRTPTTRWRQRSRARSRSPSRAPRADSPATSASNGTMCPVRHRGCAARRRRDVPPPLLPTENSASRSWRE